MASKALLIAALQAALPHAKARLVELEIEVEVAQAMQACSLNRRKRLYLQEQAKREAAGKTRLEAARADVAMAERALA